MEDSHEGKSRIAIRAQLRFKALVRLVIHNLSWLQLSEFVTDIGQLKQIISRKRKGVLSFDQIVSLKQPPEDRTPEEVNSLYVQLNELKGFKKYAEYQKIEIMKVAKFNCFGAGRVIVRQNQPATYLYYIYSGTAKEYTEQFNYYTEEFEDVEVSTLSAGNSFGEYELMNDAPRCYTIVSTTPIQVLILDQEAFDNILRTSLTAEWKSLMNAISKFTYFDTFERNKIRDLCPIAKILKFRRDETVLDSTRKTHYVYFLLKGRIQIVEHLLIQTDIINGVKKYRLHESSTVTPSPAVSGSRHSAAQDNDRRSMSRASDMSAISEIGAEEFVPKGLDTVFVQVCILSETAVFGLGENMNRRSYVAVTDVECLLIPYYWILNQGASNIWHQILVYLNNHIPSTTEVFRTLVQARKWRDYTAKLVADICRNKTPCNTIHNVPYSIRIMNDFNYK